MRVYFANLIRKILLECGFKIERHFPAKDLLIPSEIKLDMFFDIGSNVGKYAKQIRKQGYSGQIVSFEPISSAHSILLKESLSDTNWSVYDKCALGNVNGVININVSLNSYSSSVLPMLQKHLDAAPDSRVVGQESIPIYRLSDIWRSQYSEFKKIGIKIDVQGFELDVLKGAIEIIHFIEFIQIEMSLVQVYSGQALYNEVDSFLRSHGFFLWKVLPGFSDLHSGQLLQFDGIYARQF